VSDTGIGIPSEQAERIFESFVQGDASSSRRYGGTGLGLSIVHQLIAMMDSKIEFSSQVGVGSTFTFTLRVQISQEIVPEAALPAIELEQPHQEPPIKSQPQPNILVVEDNAINREMLTHIFANFGIQVAQVKDGESAVRAAQTHPYRLIMMDVKLPRMNGMDTTRLIRAIPEHASTPIIAMTASIMSDEKAQYLASGMNDVLSKPFSIQDLRNMLQRWYPESLV
jgi:CheY-like chemotaxis protein